MDDDNIAGEEEVQELLEQQETIMQQVQQIQHQYQEIQQQFVQIQEQFQEVQEMFGHYAQLDYLTPPEQQQIQRLLHQEEQTPQRNEELFTLAINLVRSENKDRLKLGCRLLHNELLIPWDSEITTRNRARIKELGLSKLFVELLANPVPSFVKQGVLCIWSYCETADAREELAQLGAAEHLIRLCKIESPIQRTCLGPLWGFLEFEDFQVKVIDEGVLEALLQSNYIKKPKHMRTRRNMIGCIFSCASNPKCRSKMIRNGIAKYLFETYAAHKGVVLKYFCLLSLAFLCMTESIETQADLDVLRVLKLTTDFLQQFKYEQIVKEEEKDQYSWCTLVPFYRLTLSRYQQFRHLGIFCLTNLAARSVNHKTLKLENIFPAVSCFCWDSDPSIRHLAQKMTSYFTVKDPPSLVDIVSYNIRNHYPQNSDIKNYESLFHNVYLCYR